MHISSVAAQLLYIYRCRCHCDTGIDDSDINSDCNRITTMFSKSKAQKPSGSRRSSTMIALIIVPTVILFFVAGMFIGSKFVEGDFTDGQNAFTGNGADTGIRKGLPGTNNILNRWSEGNMKYLRGAAAEIVDIARRAEALVGLSPPAQVIDASKIEKVDVPGAVTVDEKKLVLEGLGRPMMPNSMYNSPPEVQHIVAGAHVPERHIVSGSQQMEELKMSLHATEHSFMKGPSNLDDANIIAGAWVYLDDTRQDNDMRTIFTNKKSGCENENEQYGLSMYVNAWQTNDHRLYVEYGGLESGCHKLDSGTVELHPKHWYHVAVHLGDDNAALFIDGTIVSTNGIGSVEKHQVQSTRPLLVGQYDDSAFPFYGNISHLAFIHCHADWTASTVGDVVKSMMDVKLVSKITGLHALYTLSDAVTETSGAVAVDTTHSYNGIYTFPLSRNSHRGVVIDLIDGTKDRVVTKEMKDEGDRLGRVRRENVKDGMKHAWKGYKDHAWGFDEILPLTRDGSDRWGGMGVTLVDSLDTLWIMGMKEEFKEARDWVANKLSFKHADTVSVFEVSNL